MMNCECLDATNRDIGDAMSRHYDDVISRNPVMR